jgi:pimeloyl-ACP methyl ester carboxylesterase
MASKLHPPFCFKISAVILATGGMLLVGCAPIATVNEILPPQPVAFTGNQTNPQLQKARTNVLSAESCLKSDPLRSMAESETAAMLCLDALKTLSGARANEAIELYNYAVARLVEAIVASGKKPWEQEICLPGPAGPLWLNLKVKAVGAYIPSTDRLLAADRMEIGGTHFTNRVHIDGIGAPFISEGPGRKDPWAFDHHYYAVTAEFRFSGAHGTIEILDPIETTRIDLAGENRPVAADLSAPLALGITKTRVDTLGIRRLLSTDRFMSAAKLIMVGPYRPNRTPVILIHGLGDVPVTFTALVNGLNASAEFRSKYQLWVYQYPSGLPFPYSASLLRQALDEVYQKYPDTPKAILIGHSMGGLIADLMIRDSGSQYEQEVLGKPLDQFRLTSGQAKIMRDALVFKARPYVSGVIFIATPHRGAEMASGPLGRFAASLVSLPRELIMLGPNLISQLQANEEEELIDRLPNSIDTLRPTARVITAMDRLPIKPSIACYSIIGDEDEGKVSLANSSDGIVPYWSSHLASARSELIVPYGHSYVQSSPPCIAEVKRILVATRRN